VRQYNRDGDVVWQYEIPMFGQDARPGHGPDSFGNRLFSAIPDGDSVLIGTGNGHSVLSIDRNKAIQWSITQNQWPGIRLAWVTVVQKRVVGDQTSFLIGNCHAGPDQPIVIEVDGSSREVLWKLDGHDRFGNNVSNFTAVPPSQLAAFGLPVQ